MDQEVTVGDYVVYYDKFIEKSKNGNLYQCKRISNPDEPPELIAKIISLQSANENIVNSELKIMQKIQKCDNPNLIKIFGVFTIEEKNEMCIIMEKCSQNLKCDLDSRKKNNTWYTIQEAIHIIASIVNGYKVLYDNQIIHRAIKLENILISNKNVYKLTDYGQGKVIEDILKKLKLTKVGAPIYTAPELFLETYQSSQLDVYSVKIAQINIQQVGVVFHYLIYGQPHLVPNQKEFQKQLKNLEVNPIKCQELNWNSEEVPTPCRQLIENMILFNEEKRISWQQLFVHPLLFPSSKFIHLKIKFNLVTLNNLKNKKKILPFQKFNNRKLKRTKILQLNYLLPKQAIFNINWIIQRIINIYLNFRKFYQILITSFNQFYFYAYYASLSSYLLCLAYNLYFLIENFNQVSKQIQQVVDKNIIPTLSQYKQNGELLQSKIPAYQQYQTVNKYLLTFVKYGLNQFKEIQKLGVDQIYSGLIQELQKGFDYSNFTFYYQWSQFIYNRDIKNKIKQQQSDIEYLRMLYLFELISHQDEDYPYEQYKGLNLNKLEYNQQLTEQEMSEYLNMKK